MLAIPQSYSFQYLNETMPGAFPRNTKGIDRWGYYNGAVGNSMLFDATLFSYTPVMPAADREVHSIQSQGGLLSRMTYPTGGYTNFAYEPNLVPYNPSNPGMSNCPANHFVQTNASHNTNGTIDFVQNSGSFTIDSCNGNLTMPVTIDFGQVPVDSFNSPVKNLYSILSIYSETNGILVYKAPFLGYKNYYSTTIVLPPGTYNYTVTCDNNQTTTGHPVYTYARMTFYKKPVSGPPLNAVYGAGMRIKSITSYDNINNSVPALTRTYSYSLAQLLSIPTYGYSSVTHDWSFYQANGESGTCAWGEYIEKIYTSDYSSPIFSLINNQFYYPTVTEYSLIDTSK
ncbi:MAG TPA: hypothetical protein PLA68_10040, partial [Panacibacter sp.]|nr:hypothetical protein [Panacibacter sp.]